MSAVILPLLVGFAIGMMIGALAMLCIFALLVKIVMWGD